MLHCTDKHRKYIGFNAILNEPIFGTISLQCIKLNVMVLRSMV